MDNAARLNQRVLTLSLPIAAAAEWRDFPDLVDLDYIFLRVADAKVCARIGPGWRSSGRGTDRANRSE